MKMFNFLFFIFVIQLLSAVTFLLNILSGVFGMPLGPIKWQYHEILEIFAAFGLILGVVVSSRYLITSKRRSDRLESQLRAASGAFGELLEDRMTEWSLTPAERDVAIFSIKGLSIQDIAELRGSSSGTIKAQMNAIYRKAGVNGRSQLMSLFLDELMSGQLNG